jgi:hypothetical protein
MVDSAGTLHRAEFSQTVLPDIDADNDAPAVISDPPMDGFMHHRPTVNRVALVVDGYIAGDEASRDDASASEDRI